MDCARDGESAKGLRAHVDRVILEDLEEKLLTLRRLHAKLRDLNAGESFVGSRAVAAHLSQPTGGRLFEIHLSILDVRERDTDPPSFLGRVERFPEALAHATSLGMPGGSWRAQRSSLPGRAFPSAREPTRALVALPSSAPRVVRPGDCRSGLVGI